MIDEAGAAIAAAAKEPDEPACDDADDDTWLSFEQSVAYMASLSSLYKDAFLRPSKKAVTAAHVDAAKGHAREAMELLASNLLNASAAVTAQLESQGEAVTSLESKLAHVKRRIEERDQRRDDAIVRRFYEHKQRAVAIGHVAPVAPATGQTISTRSTLAPASLLPTASLKLPLAAASTSYLYH